MTDHATVPLGLFIQPACLQHKYIRHPNSSHIFERPERLRAVLLGVAAAVARLEGHDERNSASDQAEINSPIATQSTSTGDDLSGLLSSLSIGSSSNTPLNALFTPYLHVVPPPALPAVPGTILLHHPAVQLAHSPVGEAPFPYIGVGSSSSAAGALPSSPYLKDLFKWASEAVEKIRETGCEIPAGLGLNQGDLYLGPGSIVAIEGAIQTVCQAVDQVTRSRTPPATPSGHEARATPSTPPAQTSSQQSISHATPPNAQSTSSTLSNPRFKKAFCAIRPPGHHCGEDEPSGFCYVNNVVVGAIHAYLQHDIDRAIIIDFDLHHGNGTQALVMPLNAASHAEDLMLKAGKPAMMRGRDGKTRRGWKGFYGSVHDIYSYPCEDGDLDLVKDASISLAAHGQYIENIHLQPYESEADFYERIYPLYLALLKKAKMYMDETQAEPSRTMVFISAGFDACEHEHQGMQRHDRRVPTSFFSRYTKDIVAFADQYTEGKVVSVLEGGYSDRALTSAAMGHIVGMSGRLPEGCNEWWTEPELVNLEKATKKRRTGKLAPFPSEYSSQPHLVRTHTIFGHFEDSNNRTPDSAAPSVANTPQPGSRMTLRDRRIKADDLSSSTELTPPAKRAVRGRGGGSGGSTTTTPTRARAQLNKSATTPTQLKPVANATTSSARATSSNNTDEGASSVPGKAGDVVTLPEVIRSAETDEIEEALRGLASVSLNTDSSGVDQDADIKDGTHRISKMRVTEQTSHAGQDPPRPQAGPNSEPSGTQEVIQPQSLSKAPAPSTSIPKIILRIPRPPTQPITQTSSSLYPAIPQFPTGDVRQPQTFISNSQPEFRVKEEEKLAYREGSTSTEEGSEYVSARSGSESAPETQGPE